MTLTRNMKKQFNFAEKIISVEKVPANEHNFLNPSNGGKREMARIKYTYNGITQTSIIPNF